MKAGVGLRRGWNEAAGNPAAWRSGRTGRRGSPARRAWSAPADRRALSAGIRVLPPLRDSGCTGRPAERIPVSCCARRAVRRVHLPVPPAGGGGVLGCDDAGAVSGNQPLRAMARRCWASTERRTGGAEEGSYQARGGDHARAVGKLRATRPGPGRSGSGAPLPPDVGRWIAPESEIGGRIRAPVARLRSGWEWDEPRSPPRLRDLAPCSPTASTRLALTPCSSGDSASSPPWWGSRRPSCSPSDT